MYSLKATLYPIYMNLKNLILNYNQAKEDFKEEKKQKNAQFEEEKKTLDVYKEKQNKAKKDLDDLKKMKV